MGNALRFLCGNCFNPIDHQEYEPLEDHRGFSTDAIGVSSLAHDLFHFDITSQGLLKFYGLPILRDRVEVPDVVVFPPPPPPPQQVKYVLQSFRVDARGITAGDCLTVYLGVADTRDAPNVPKVVQIALSKRMKAQAVKDYAKADALYNKIMNADYRLLRKATNVEILAKRYRIRLRGIDAPEDKMHYGKEAKEELIDLVQGNCLTIGVYGEDKHGRLVGDVYCNGQFVQEVMLKKGCGWHCTGFDNRSELTKWEMEARAAGVGLWALSNPEKPWDWRIPIITKTTC